MSSILMKLALKALGSTFAFAGFGMLLFVGIALFGESAETALQYLGFGVIFGLLLVAVGLTMAMPDEIQ